MKIYFTASLSAKEKDQSIGEVYSEIVEKLEQLGHTVIADHVLDLDLDFVEKVDDEYRVNYYRTMLKNINEADIVFAEMTHSSSSIGHEVTLALEKNKAVIIATQTGEIPQIFKALKDQQVYFIEYKETSELLNRLEEELDLVKEGEDIRFNFLIPPSMVDYLEWVSKQRRVPKSVFLRNLIRGEMEKDTDYGSS
ncbi:hypothetical protein GW793_01730 [bacterium]|uniref:Nucleoside 2-deoxyribosyltransferase n=2 Tax=Katanobacteria TaxID=422282 RepID=A0A2M7X1T9_UNCKA|nr:hypothetical protein [bacterium]PIP56785.1 MAG: hypothetical protein COX05_01155 [candidate division WWE3 bacterium CG22_combo_CG10-13_8_21_14_all_39_12]PJA40132.1 MAG: hypothetical protein CO179_03210 [candidate division WWE3 bacterium CG_4_9_14_3_um_filter_39_7]